MGGHGRAVDTARKARPQVAVTQTGGRLTVAVAGWEIFSSSKIMCEGDGRRERAIGNPNLAPCFVRQGFVISFFSFRALGGETRERVTFQPHCPTPYEGSQGWPTVWDVSAYLMFLMFNPTGWIRPRMVAPPRPTLLLLFAPKKVNWWLGDTLRHRHFLFS